MARLRQVQRGLPELLHVFSRPDAEPERSRDLQNEKRLFLSAPERPHRTLQNPEW